jgi:hypothetical protein
LEVLAPIVGHKEGRAGLIVLDSYCLKLCIKPNDLDRREAVLFISVVLSIELSIGVRFAVSKVTLLLVSLAHIGRKVVAISTYHDRVLVLPAGITCQKGYASGLNQYSIFATLNLVCKLDLIQTEVCVLGHLFRRIKVSQGENLKPRSQ